MIKRNSLFLAFAVALLATLSSLYVSEALGQETCKLCWSQRIFLFPLPILLFSVTLFNRPDVVPFILPLPILGALASINHIVIAITQCDDCSNISMIPFWSLGAFLLIAFFLFLSLGRKRTKDT